MGVYLIHQVMEVTEMKEKIMKAAGILKANGISGTVKDAWVDGNVVFIKIQERKDWDLSSYEINLRSGKMAG